MRLTVVIEHRFQQTDDGAVWTDSHGSYSFWSRYLEVFDAVQAVARVHAASQPADGWKRADGPRVAFTAIPPYQGPRQYLLNARATREAVRRAVAPGDAVMLRVPGHLAGLVWPQLRRQRHPYAVEVLGDPWDVFSPGAIRHPLRPFFRRWFARQLRNQCRHAAAAAYVTAHALQQRYPPGPDTWSTHFSDVEVEGFLCQQPRAAAAKSAWQLVTVGSLAHLYKGVDTLLDALAGCRRSGLDLRLSVVGGGQHLEELRRRAAGLGVLQHVLFRGQVASREELAAELDRADLFVLPSRQEGLPRALLEAMARGLPCIGSDVGGIPELLPAADLTPANQPVALSRKIAEVLQSPSRLAAMSQRNLTTAQGYSEGELGQRRTAFYQRLRAVTAGWSGEQTAPMASGTPHTACNRG